MSATSSIRTPWTRKLVVQVLLPTLAAVLAVFATAVPYVLVVLERHQLDVLTERLMAEARELADQLPPGGGPQLDVVVGRLARSLGVRVTVIAADGRVVGESSEPSAQLENHGQRPEVVDALARGEGWSVRDSATVGASLLYAAVRSTHDGETRIVRVAAPMARIHTSLRQVRQTLLAGLLVAALTGILVAAFVSRRMVRRIRRLVTFTGEVAAGRPMRYLGPELPDELGVLESQLADMAARIAETITALRVEQERQEAILRGMVEGVVVTDLDDRVVLLNARGTELLDVPPDLDPRGRPLIEQVREPRLADMLRQLAGGAQTVSGDATVGHRALQVNGARLAGPDGYPFGSVLVLHDVTELRHLEVVRRDFVANVSHELRTPLTAIKGYAETLLGPAGDDRETARRFLTVIDRHSERLGRLIEDLLGLSDLELGRFPIRPDTVSVAPVVDDIVQLFTDRALRAGVALESRVPADVPPIRADGDRLRQVLINLVENAIKYTAPGGQVTLTVRGDRRDPTGMVTLAIADTGVGIPAQDVPRLTERFFRVDKARSREMGGTGLGLAIVKHIVQAHGGTLAIESEYGHGTTITVRWPQAEAVNAPMPTG